MIDEMRHTRALRALAPLGGRWQPLGHGKEGIVLTDRLRVCKLFDGWIDKAASEIEPTLDRVQLVIDRCAGTSWLPPQPRLGRIGQMHALFYGYETTEPFGGGCERQFVDMLCALRVIGLMYFGFRTSSFRVGPRGLLLVDLGVDMRPYEATRWRHNLERAFLLARHGHRSDLKNMQQRALVGEAVPELDGLASFLRRCEEPR